MPSPKGGSAAFAKVPLRVLRMALGMCLPGVPIRARRLALREKATRIAAATLALAGKHDIVVIEISDNLKTFGISADMDVKPSNIHTLSRV